MPFNMKAFHIGYRSEKFNKGIKQLIIHATSDLLLNRYTNLVNSLNALYCT